MRSSRSLLAAVVTALASVAILMTLLAHYASVLTDSSSFSSRAVTVVHTGPVESLIVDTVTGRLMNEVGADFGLQPGLQPQIRSAVRQALSDGRVTAEVRSAAASLQDELAAGQTNSLTLTLPDIGPSIASTIESSSPQLAEVVSRVGTITVLDVHIPPAAASAIHDLATVERDSSLLIVFSVALVALALLLTPDRRRTLLGLGLGTCLSGLVTAALYLAGRSLVVGEFSSQAARTAADTAWDVYLGGLETSGFVLAAAGAVVAIGAALLRRRRDPRMRSYAGA